MDFLLLGGLALLDSLSVGTLIIPIVALVAWRGLRPAPYATYLITIALSYLALGITLMLGITFFTEVAHLVSSSTWFSWVTLLLGVALAAYGILSPTPKKKTVDDITAERAQPRTASRSTFLAMVALALGAAVVEAATMLPYLAAISLLHTTGLAFGVRTLILALYCLVMITPAALIGVAAGILGPRIFGALTAILPRLEYETRVTLLWVAAIIGIILVSRSLPQLGGF